MGIGADRVGALAGLLQAGARILETGILGVGSERVPMGFEVVAGAVLAGDQSVFGAERVRSENNFRCSTVFGVGLTMGVGVVATVSRRLKEGLSTARGAIVVGAVAVLLSVGLKVLACISASRGDAIGRLEPGFAIDTGGRLFSIRFAAIAGIAVGGC